jgi:hypothetical protein
LDEQNSATPSFALASLVRGGRRRPSRFLSAGRHPRSPRADRVSGATSPELDFSPDVGVDYYLWSVQISGIGTLLTGVNFVTTILKLRARHAVMGHGTGQHQQGGGAGVRHVAGSLWIMANLNEELDTIDRVDELTNPAPTNGDRCISFPGGRSRSRNTRGTKNHETL